MRIVLPFRLSLLKCSNRKSAARAASGFICTGIFCLAIGPSSLFAQAAEEPAPRINAPVNAPVNATRPPIVIRPANYDPADDLAYTRLRGEVEPGNVAGGNVWNKPPEDLRAAVSGANSTPPAPAESAEPVSAASGIPVPQMSYAQAYAQVPFSRSEYEANPGYRHDAALELMFGVQRPVTVMRQSTPYFSRYPDLFRYRYSVFPYSYSGEGTSNVNMNWNTSLIAY